MAFRLIDHKDRFKGRRIWVVGAGPSLNDVDLSLLNSEIVVCVNNVIAARNRLKIDYHVVWGWNRFIRLVPEIIVAAKECPGMRIICAPPYQYLRKYIETLKPFENVCLVARFKRRTSKTHRKECEKYTADGTLCACPLFRRAWQWQIPWCTYFAIRWAQYLGASSLYYLGQDGILRPDQSHFSDAFIHNFTKSKRAKKLNGFCGRMEKIARRLTAQGTPVINCSPGSALNIPQMTLEDVVSQPDVPKS